MRHLDAAVSRRAEDVRLLCPDLLRDQRDYSVPPARQIAYCVVTQTVSQKQTPHVSDNLRLTIRADPIHPRFPNRMPSIYKPTVVMHDLKFALVDEHLTAR